MFHYQNLGSSSFRPNSYNHSYNMNEPPHRPVYNNNNIQSSSISASGGGSGGGEYYENSSNMSSSSSNDYYNNNYRNYGQANKNEQEKYWNDSRASKSRSMGNNQKMGKFSVKNTFFFYNNTKLYLLFTLFKMI
jgi:hypothetical protein